MYQNPIGTSGIAFLEFATLEKGKLENVFKSFGFTKVADKDDIAVYEQGAVNFIINTKLHSYARRFARRHGSSVCSVGIYVDSANMALQAALMRGATRANDLPKNALIDEKAIYGIGNSLIYFVDGEYNDITEYLNIHRSTYAFGESIAEIDHLTYNVMQGELDVWADFYKKIFNFREIRFFEIAGKHTGLRSRAMISPCGKIKIPINESIDDRSQIEEFIKVFNGEGIQHIALSTNSIYQTVQEIKNQGISFLSTPDTYYEAVNTRLPWHTEDISQLKELQILIDGEKSEESGFLLQIFTENLLGPVFFEIIQRKGNDGFGEGNFQALFESIELDQIRRGVLEVG